MDTAARLRKAAKSAKAGDPLAALALYADILRKTPANTRARQAAEALLATLPAPPPAQISALRQAYEAGDAAHAQSGALALAERYPFSEALWTLIGASAQALSRLDMATRAFAQAARIAPHRATCHKNHATALRLAGDITASADAARNAAALAPDDETLQVLAADALMDAGAAPAADALLRAALRRHPQSSALHFCTGTLALDQGQPSARAHLEAAAALAPDDPRIFNNLAIACLNAGDTDAALTAARRAITLDPDHAAAHQTLGNAHQQSGQIEAAITAYGQAVSLDPSLHAAQLQMLHFQAALCDFDARASTRTVAPTLGLSGPPVPPWPLLAFEDHPARQQQRAAHFASVWPVERPGFTRVAAHRRIRLGYISSDVFDHATMRLLIGVLEHHNRARFDLRLYALNPPRADAMRGRITRTAPGVTHLHDTSEAESIQTIRADEIDIAIDLKGYTHGARPALFAAGLAPLQVNYLGYPGTLGSAAYDYMIADDRIVPDAERAHISERLITLPHSYQPFDNARRLPDSPPARADHGLPDDALVLCAFHASYKITPDVFAIWMTALRGAKHAVLWVLEPQPPAKRALQAAAQAQGIDPDRLIFAPALPQEAHLARHLCADLFLDTWPVGAHTTASDALSMGLPVLTCSGRQMASRVGASLNCAIGLEEMTTSTPEAYVAKLDALLANPPALAAARHKLGTARKTAPMFDTASYTRHLEDGFEQAFARWQAGQAPADIRVTPAPYPSAAAALSS